VDDEVEDSVVAANEEQIEESVESEVLASTEQAVEGAVEESSDELVESSVEQASEEQVEEQVSEQVAAATESSIENSSEESVEQETTDAVNSSVDDLLEESASSALLAVTEESVSLRMEAEVDEVLDTIESDLEVDTDRISRGQWLVMAEPSVFDELAAEGYVFDTFTELAGLGLRLAEVAAPASFDISAAREGIIDVVGSDRAQVDLNHIYTAGVPDSIDFDAGWSPSEALVFPADTHTLAMKIGIVDSAVDTQHEALVNTKVNTRRDHSLAPGSRCRRSTARLSHRLWGQTVLRCQDWRPMRQFLRRRFLRSTKIMERWRARLAWLGHSTGYCPQAWMRLT